MGMHGSGLTHLLFLPDWGGAFEMYDNVISKYTIIIINVVRCLVTTQKMPGVIMT